MAEPQMTEPNIDEKFLNSCIVTARRAAKSTEQIIKRYYKDTPDITIKDDLTPVTQADIECEKVIKQVLAAQFPDFGFYGEETGRLDTNSDFTWLVDPIDGTKSFVREYHFFSTQIALMYKGEIIMGLSHAPMFSETAWAAIGLGAFINDKPLTVSSFTKAEDSCYSTGNLQTFCQNKQQWEKLRQVMSLCHKTRGYGDFYHYHLLAAGKIELVIESDVNILDIAALSILVTEAGGKISDLAGQKVDLHTTSIVAGNPATYDKALIILNT
ncbi:Histidinol-phosphatase [alternative form] [hydrothermal vent metagenome]|uniref:Histidinol-phosphatase [alternative form] n=1 Tax=hydrothermal vent metagenome TaxID=652676 RepID=A0A3B0V112_9ZZZZ